MPDRAGPDSRDESDGPEPLEISVALDGGTGCIGQARDTAARFLTEARDVHRVAVAERAVQNAQLVVSELVTNVVKYAPGPALLQMRIQDGLVLVEVWDSDPRQPAVRDTDPQRIGQHGLEIVSLLARSLTVQPTSVGKRVTVSLDLTPSTSPHAA
ncbi:ATP-binding protein [Streptomyces sp. NPDC088785]|uniref:ATP-binding protein n=1 Tax=Streptomyces sp. NPDC088785 TaxID=3365897 RepID=UPI0037F71422